MVRLRFPAILVGALPLLFSGCAANVESIPAAAQETPPPGLNDIQVCQAVYVLSEPWQGGTAVALGDGRFVTCRHNFPVDAPWIYMNGAKTPVRVLAAGANERVPSEDWAIIAIPGAAMPGTAPLSVDTRRQLHPGQIIYLIGFPAPEGRDRLPLQEVLSLPRTTVRAEVVQAPSNLQGQANGLAFVKAPRRDAYHGMSGGAAVVWDPDQQRWVLVGIYRGATTELTGVPGLFTWSRKTDTHVIVRVPAL